MENVQKCYWNEKGKYQNIYIKLHRELVKPSSSSDTVQGELIRAIGRLYYEYCNNGNCNAKNQQWEEVGTGNYEEIWNEVTEEWEDGDEEMEDEYVSTDVDKFYSRFLSLIVEFIPEAKEECDAVGDVICQDNKYTFEGKELQAYINLSDKVISWAARNLKTELTFPNWYDKD